jgi:glycosyltransferase 2 family protein
MSDEFRNEQTGANPPNTLQLTANSLKLKTNSLKLSLGLALAVVGFWYATRGIDDFTAVVSTLQQLRPLPILLATLTIFLTLFAKAWRWQLLFTPRTTAPPLRQAARTLFAGQFVNLLLPVARLGELTRIFLLGGQTSKAQILGTIVLEKTLDLITLSLMLLLVIPFLALPDTLINEPALLAGLALTAGLILYLLAYHTPRVLAVVAFVSRALPVRWQGKVYGLVGAGLEGLGRLREPTTAVFLLLLSALIGFLGALAPFLLFYAFTPTPDLGFRHAILLNVVISVGSLPIAVPAHLGVFEALTIFTLTPFTQASPAQLFSYAILFHLVVLLPMLLLGGIATASTGLSLRTILWGNPTPA